jgi:hypothetical protein
MDDSANSIVPIHNLPNLKQGQNGIEVATTIYKIVLDAKAHLPGPKEVAVSYYYYCRCCRFVNCRFVII